MAQMVSQTRLEISWASAELPGKAQVSCQAISPHATGTPKRPEGPISLN